LQSPSIELVTPKETGLSIEVAETGNTYQENARLKALAMAKESHLISLADDSGLEVKYLGGEPGVISARYAGKHASDEDNYRKLLHRLEGMPDRLRTALFRCALALATPEGEKEVVTGECKGIITHEPRGSSGFGYDPVFYYPEYGKTFAELEPEMKDRVSHRRRAIEKLLLILPRYLPRGG